MFEEATQDDIGSQLVIMGDFNCNVLHPNPCTQELLMTADACGLKQNQASPSCRELRFCSKVIPGSHQLSNPPWD